MATRTKETATSLAQVLDALTAEGVLYEKLEGGKVRCYACGHRCLIPAGQRGICKVRFNQDGVLRVPRGYVAALQCDPIEKKPFFHVYPGSDALTFGMLGCDLHCAYCQNWITSQALRDPVAGVAPRRITARELVELARQGGARLVASSYNEPLITAEWAVEVFQEARPAGFLCGFISNGNATPEVLKMLRPWVDCYKVDLKSMRDKNYRRLGCLLETVLQTIRLLVEMKFWVEVVTLVVPGFNDSEEELRDAARFLASVSRDIPWHVTAFHKDYKMTEPENTSARQLVRAMEIGAEEGLRYLYAGNLPGMVGPWEDTRCPGCGRVLIARYGYIIRRNDLGPDGKCPGCGQSIPGIWGDPQDRKAGPRVPRPLL